MKECLYLAQLQEQQNSSPSASPTNSNVLSGLFFKLGSDVEMPCWYYDKKELKDTASILDGISFETERRYRKEGARFIMSCGTQMGLGHNTMATGVVYFHRFYMFHSFKSFPRYVTACCCLFLAGKVEETPKKCRDIIKTARSLLSDNQFYSFGDDPKEEVMTLERILLQTIKFNLQVEHPYSFLLKYAKCIKGDQQKLQKMVQMAWNFVNDSLSTVVCLQWEPEIIAVALIHLASKLSKFTVVDWVGRQPNHVRWWDMFVSDVTMEILEDICHQVLDLYQSNQKEVQTAESPPQKPPSRADSPTPLRNISMPSTSGTASSNAAKTNSPVSKKSSTSTVHSASVASTSTSSHNNSSIGELNNVQPIKTVAMNSVNSASTSNNALNASANEPIPPPPAGPIPNTFHMFVPQPPPVNPHQMHSLYGSGSSAPAPPPPPPQHAAYNAPLPPVPSGANVNIVAPPPLPPPPPLGGYAPGPPPPPHSNTWVPSMNSNPHGHGYAGGPPMPSHHNSGGMRSHIPPPPPSHASGSSGYYGQQSYGRQGRY